MIISRIACSVINSVFVFLASETVSRQSPLISRGETGRWGEREGVRTGLECRHHVWPSATPHAFWRNPSRPNEKNRKNDFLPFATKTSKLIRAKEICVTKCCPNNNICTTLVCLMQKAFLYRLRERCKDPTDRPTDRPAAADADPKPPKWFCKIFETNPNRFAF